MEQLPNNISTFDFKDFAFAYCCNIEEVNINGLEVSYGCFYGCTNLKMIHFSGGQSIDIGEYSFAKCENLERLDLHKMQIIRIYNHAFSNCNSLKLLIMPKNERLPIEISETAFSHCNTNKLVLQWGIDGYIYSVEKYYQKEKKKNEEENKRTLSATKKFKQRFLDAISNLKKTSENDVRRNKIIGDFYDKEGEHLGSCICNMLKFNLCSWVEYFCFGEFFYKSIRLSEITGGVRTNLIIWANYCTIQSYLLAPMHHKKRAIRLLLNILHSAYYPFQDSLTTSPLSILEYRDKWQIKHRFHFDMLYLNLFICWGFNKIKQKVSTDERSVIELISSFHGDAIIISLLKFRLLHHLLSINSINNEPNWNIKAMDEEFCKAKSFLIDKTGATEKVLKKIASYMWTEFIKDNVNRDFQEIGETEYDFDNNIMHCFGFDYDRNQISWVEKQMEDYYYYNNYTDNNYSEDFYNNYTDDEESAYGKYAGSYAQDVMGYSDDDIDTIFDGDPDAYWNID